MNDAVVGLIGVAVGAGLTIGADEWRARVRDARQRKVAARALTEACGRVVAMCYLLRKNDALPPDPGMLRAPADVWDQHHATFVAAIPVQRWGECAAAAEMIRLSTISIQQSGETIGPADGFASNLDDIVEACKTLDGHFREHTH